MSRWWLDRPTAVSPGALPIPAFLEDNGPVPALRRGPGWWKVYLPYLGLFRYRLTNRKKAPYALPCVDIERGTAFAGWKPENGERVRLEILRAHGVKR